MNRNYFLGLILMSAITSCSVNRFLPPGEKLYKGARIVVKKSSEVKESEKELAKQLKLAVKPNRNKFILGQPYKVWWWYVIGESKKEKGLRPFLRRKLGEAPVLSSRINANATAENIQSFMENTGYFHTTVRGDTLNSGYFTKAIYTANVQPQYHIKSIKWIKDSSDLLNLLEEHQKRRGIIKAGDPYTLSNISAERDRLDLYLKNRGYYYFNADYLMAYADSSIGNRQVDLYFNVKKNIPEQAKYPYYINNIAVFPNYSLLKAQMDTSISGAVGIDRLYIKDSTKKFKPKLFSNAVTYRPGSLYSSRSQNSTLNRLISLGTFKFVKNRFEADKDSANKHWMNVYYYLTPAKMKSLQSEVDGFIKENNSVGGQISINWKNKNLFRGAELLTLKTYAALEIPYADSLSNNNTYRLGGETSIKFPYYAIPFLRIKENNFYPPNTNLLIGYELYRRQLYYTKNLFRLQYDFTWKTNANNEFTFAPVSLSYLNASDITDSFYRQVIATPEILFSVYSEAILGSYFTYTFNKGSKRGKNKWHFNAGIDLSGNIAGLVSGAKSFRQKEIFNTPFAQYVKTDFDLHYTRKLVKNVEWANRIQLGIGFPYSNSALLPFAKQYFIGGSSSIRGFRVRNLGPGTYKPTLIDQRFFQLIGGDYKFLFNSEIRLSITSSLSTTVFFDAGNIWTKDTLLFGKQGQLSKNWFKELAVASGIGVRYDASVVLIRVDIGVPLRKPYLPDGQRWVLKQIDFGSSAWRRENLILNIALGLPF